MFSTPDHGAIKRVLTQNILLQSIFCINCCDVVTGSGRLKAKIEWHYRITVEH
jgi:hypothetical protein